ncbi:Eaa protein, partial [Enterobacter hormaechei]
MSATLKEWLVKTIAELEEERDATPGAVNEDAANALAAMKLALASLEAEASGRNPVLAYADSYRDMANQGVESIPVWSVITDLERNIAPLFTAPPAPISVPAAMEMDDDFDSAFEHGKAVGWNACRAAMLQGVDRPQNEP